MLLFVNQRVGVIADTHFGKAAHFQKSGITLSSKANQADEDRLLYLIDKYELTSVIIAGDLFHSHSNEEVAAFQRVVERVKPTCFVLTAGNHDILPKAQYEAMCIVNVPYFDIEGWRISHFGDKKFEEPQIVGHIHPTVLIGKAHNRARLKCYHLDNQTLTLPAFTSLSTGATIRPASSDCVWMIAGDEVIKKMPLVAPSNG